MRTLLFKRCCVILSIFLFACSTPPKKKPSRFERPSPSAIELLQILKAKRDAINTLEGRIRSKITTARGKKSTSQLIFLKKPAHLRFDILTPFGAPAVTFTTDGAYVDLYYYSDKIFYSGASTHRRLQHIFPRQLRFKDLAQLISGAIPLIALNTQRSNDLNQSGASATQAHLLSNDDLADLVEKGAVVNSDGSGYQLILKNDVVIQKIQFDPGALEPVNMVVEDTGGKLRMKVIMSDYNDIDGVKLPMRIKTILPESNYTLDITFQEIIINPEYESDIFNQAPPDDASFQDLDNLPI